MGRVFFFGVFFCAAAGLMYPWIGVLYGYLADILTPQDIWFWDFRGIRAEFWVLMPTCIGATIWLLTNRFDLSLLRNRRNAYYLLLWVAFLFSYFMGPYAHVKGPYRFDSAQAALWRINKIMVLYFVACLCIDSERKAKYLFLVLAGSVAYMTYWANHQYWTGAYFGRLGGPSGGSGHSLYGDQNAFAMLFVVAQPFFWYLGLSMKRRIMRWACWLVMALSWNAIFLTASRGGFLGLVVVLLLLIMRSRRKFLGLLLIPIFSFAVVYHGGHMMKSRIFTIDHYHKDGSAEDRLHAWQAAIRMIEAHPITGVGIAGFGPAFPHYSHHHPREAHNTLLQLTAESGVLAGAMYILIAVSLIGSLWRNGNYLKRQMVREDCQTLIMINEATLIGFCGFIVCALFLSLQFYEIYYCLGVLANAVLYLSAKRDSEKEQPVALSATYS